MKKTWWTEKSHRKESHGNKVTEKKSQEKKSHEKSHKNKTLIEIPYNLYIHELENHFHK